MTRNLSTARVLGVEGPEDLAWPGQVPGRDDSDAGQSMPKGQYRELPDRRRDMEIAVLVPVFVEFFSAA